MLTLRRRTEDERGVTLILMAILMVVLLGMAGLVVNLGLVRVDRQRNKGVADVAVMAGMHASDVGTDQVATFQGACAALDYLKANHPELSSLSLTSGWTQGDGTTAISGGNPCDPSSTAYANNYLTTCNPSTSTTARSTSAWFTGTTGDITVAVKAGYSNTAMANDGFRDDIYHTDTSTYNGCDQLAVIVTEREAAGFGKVFGANQLSSSIRSVGRVTFDDSSEAAVALLLIEPSECDALKIGGTGSSVRVKGTDTRPGIIHADSSGTSGCGGSARVLTGLHSDGIFAERAPNPVGAGAAGIISTYAAMPSPAYDSTTNVVAQGGTPQNNGPKGRGPVDQRYLGVGSSYGMIDLRADALDRLSWSDATATANGYTVVTNCSSLPASYTPATQKVFLRCDLDRTVSFSSSVTDVVITGRVNLNGKQVVMPNVRNLFIGGQTGNNGKGIDLNSSGVLSVNRNGFASCTLRQAANDDETTRLVVKSGQLNVGSSSAFQACSTTVYLMGTDGAGTGTLPASNGTAPANNSFNGNINVGSSGSLDWTAPNTTPSLPTAAELENFEDLAFWAETSGGNSLTGSNATMTLRGIFFTPNANSFDVNAGGAGITADAQFITRKLNNQGGGALTMTADPNNSVPIKIISGFNLVR